MNPKLSTALEGPQQLIFSIFGVLTFLVSSGTLYHLASFLYRTSPRSDEYIDFTAPTVSTVKNIGLLFLFVIQHSIMASEPYKRLWENSSIAPLQRSTYLLGTSLALEMLMAYWSPVSYVVVWQVDESWTTLISIIYIASWVIIFLQTSIIDAWELLGIKQIWYAITNQGNPLNYKTPETKSLYAHMRHPIFLSLAVAFWATPVMTFDRFCFALSMTLYLLFGNRIDDRDIQFVEDQLSGTLRSTLEKRPKVL
mmetsp:Transcript_5407/g.7596  ORF Transcript_5407/g.7596 Transcript_5407/m.7596 type:complete len:253 (-) Transcript_5407:48-806(-)